MKPQDLKPIPRKESISVQYLIENLRDKVHLDIELCAGRQACGKRSITDENLHRPGLALAGYVSLFTHHRVQVLGNTEIQYLNDLDFSSRVESFKRLLSFDCPVFFITSGNRLSDELIAIAEEANTPVVHTSVETTKFMAILQDFLEDQFALQTMLHGAMVDVYGIGILIAGKSGIGKSEVALDLIERGHRLVADDVIMVSKKGSILMSSATEMNKHFMEIRGLGIIDVMSMFGIRSIRYQKRLEVVLELQLWGQDQPVERTGLTNETVEILNVPIPRIRLPITPGKNVTVIAEIIAMNYLLKHYGYDAAKAFQAKVKEKISQKRQDREQPGRAVDYFEGDIE